LGLGERHFGSIPPPGLARTPRVESVRSNVNSGSACGSCTTPEPSGRLTTNRQRPRLAGGGDEGLRAFDPANGKVLWTFHTGHQIAVVRIDLLDRRKEYVAIPSAARRRPRAARDGDRASGLRARRSSSQSPAPPLPRLLQVYLPRIRKQIRPRNTTSAAFSYVASAAFHAGRTRCTALQQPRFCFERCAGRRPCASDGAPGPSPRVDGRFTRCRRLTAKDGISRPIQHH